MGFLFVATTIYYGIFYGCRRCASWDIADGQQNPICLSEAIMKNIKRTRVGSEVQYGPRTAGEILHDNLENGNEPLAIAFRKRKSQVKKQVWHSNTELGCDVKTFLRSDKRLLVNKEYPGILRLDTEADIDEFRCCDPHITFFEAASKSYVCHRNVHLYEGKHITCTKSLNGTARLNFKSLKQDVYYEIDKYAIEVANEIREALEGLVEEE